MALATLFLSLLCQHNGQQAQRYGSVDQLLAAATRMSKEAVGTEPIRVTFTRAALSDHPPANLKASAA
jgi:hypothetical protein